MPKQIDVHIEATATDGVDLIGGEQSLSITMDVRPEADSHGDAIVKALCQGANTAAIRIGVQPPPATHQLRLTVEKIVAYMTRVGIDDEDALALPREMCLELVDALSEVQR